MFILKFALYIFRTNTAFIIWSLRVKCRINTYEKGASCWTLYTINYDARSVQYQEPFRNYSTRWEVLWREE
jgi:hypothetical protein